MSVYRPMGFNILPVVIKNLLIINGLAFLAQQTFDPAHYGWISQMFALHDVRSVYFRPHQLVTHLFMHGGWEHIIMNMFALWLFGSALEIQWGSKKFLTFYVLSGLGAAILHLGVLYMENTPMLEYFHTMPPAMQEEWLYRPDFRLNSITVGASGAVFGCLAAFGYLFPNRTVFLYFFPIQAKWFVLIYAAGELWMGIRNSAGDNVAHWAHLGGALVGFLLARYWKRQDINRRRLY
jgi:membrane associated rhomboid family serine protease